MKTLFLIRHGKAEKIAPGMSDFERSLDQTGQKEALRMAKKFSKEYNPAYWLSSPATRAFQTAKAFAGVYGKEIEHITLNEDIYEAELPALLHIINQLPDEYNSAVLFGHNPAFTMMASYLSGQNIGNLPTAGSAGIRFGFESWAMLSKGTGELVYFQYPEH
mgnify:CR=1 FL=1